MPNLNDIATIAEALEKSPVAVAQDRCVVVRNRNATCRRCVRTCPTKAVTVAGNEVQVDASACIACGACAAACPTGALISLQPTDAALAAFVAASIAENEGRAVFACARIASKHQVAPARYAEVPCLSRVDESAILTAVAQGARDVMLVDGNCSTCKLQACIKSADEAMNSANGLIAAQGAPTRALRKTGFPEDMVEEDTEGLFGTTRRGFFSDAVGAARETAMAAAKTTLAQELGRAEKAPEIGERLRVTDKGTLPLIRVPRHEAVIDAMDAIGAPAVERLESRLFGSVAIDADRCNACGMCATFCPTGALRRDPESKLGDPLSRLEFSASDCVQCGLCVDVCWKDALELSPTVSTAELFDFEPVTIDLSRAKPASKRLFG